MGPSEYRAKASESLPRPVLVVGLSNVDPANGRFVANEASYAGIILTDVLERCTVSSAAKVFRDAHRILQKDGHLVITVAEGRHATETLWTIEALEVLLRWTGYAVTNITDLDYTQDVPGWGITAGKVGK